MDEQIEKKALRRGHIRTLTAIIVSIALIAVAILLFAYRDYISSEGLRGLFSSGGGQVSLENEAFTYEAGSGQVFAPVGSGLAVASGSGLQLLDSDGYTVARDVYAMSTPAVASCSSYAVFYDIGGTSVKAATLSGKVIDLASEQPVISVTVNSSGWMAISAEESGYKGSVTVYDPSLTPVYKWSVGSGYLLSACVSPDGEKLAAVCAAAEGGVIHFFELSDESEVGTYSASDCLLLDARWLSGSRLCALSESGAVFLDGSGELSSEYPFDGSYLAAYDWGGDYTALLLSKYRSGSSGALVTLGSDGRQLGTCDISRDLTSLSANGNGVLAFFSNELVLYSTSLNKTASLETSLGAKSAVLRSGGSVLLLSSYSAELYRFK